MILDFDAKHNYNDDYELRVLRAPISYWISKRRQ